MTAFGRSPASRFGAHARCKLAGSRLKLPSSTSAKTGVAPTSTTTSAVAVKVKLGQMTASPGPIPRAINTMTIASVPLAQVTTWRAPQNSESLTSRARTSGPRMNWQCPSTRAIASSTDRPSRRRCAATSVNGIGTGSRRARCFIEWVLNRSSRRSNTSAGQPSGAAPATAHTRHGALLEATDGDFETCDAFLACHGRLPALANRCDKGLQLGAQRFGVADREMAHGIAAVGLKTEAFGHLPRQQVGHDVFVARRDRDVACLEWREPIRVDVGEHAGGGTELQQRDILALGDRIRELRLHLGDFRVGEPTNEVDVVHGEIDDHAHIGHARRKRSDPRYRD